MGQMQNTIAVQQAQIATAAQQQSQTAPEMPYTAPMQRPPTQPYMAPMQRPPLQPIQMNNQSITPTYLQPWQQHAWQHKDIQSQASSEEV